ncbi:hypothetical protein AB0B57_36700 [Micromonospora sp. NPDC049101]
MSHSQRDHDNGRHANLTAAAVSGVISGLIRAIADWIIMTFTRDI